jgi:hypothetical protein
MEKYEFVKRIEELKPILKGRWRQVSWRANVEYHVVQNYVKGFAPDAALRVSILQACEQEVEEITKMIQDITE